MASHFITSPFTLSIIIGVLPSVIWLVFWLHLARNRREPFSLIILCFFLGAASVFLATTLQHGVKSIVGDSVLRITLWAGIEEIVKFGIFYFVAYKSTHDTEALDPAMYLIAVALGFAALENVFYILKPMESYNVTASLLTGGLRFFGSTLLHAISSCFIGICTVLTVRKIRPLGMLFGISGAIFLHTTFNFFILKNDTASYLQIYGFLWIAAIISHLILEKIRRFPPRALSSL